MSHEIYRNSTQFVYLDIYGDTADPGSVSATISNEFTETVAPEGPDTTSVPGAERWAVTIGFAHTQDVGEIKVVWEVTIDGNSATKTDYFDVVVPLISLSDIRNEISANPVEMTDDQLARVESKVRSFIESYTNQQFAPKHETLLVRTESPAITLPKRLLRLHTDSVINSYPYRIENDGWVLNLLTPSYVEYPGVIYPPPAYDIKRDAFEVYSRSPRRYKTDRTVQIDGYWGWDRVPVPVQEAAYLLVQDFLSNDSIYRDKYLTSMTAADWRIQFNSGAWRGTGNARADQLLMNYVVQGGWAVV